VPLIGWDYGIAWWYGLAPEIEPPLLSGDFDNDNDVDGADFLAWQRNPSVGSLYQASMTNKPREFPSLVIGPVSGKRAS